MFDELARMSLLTPYAGTRQTYLVKLAIIIQSKVLALFQVCEWHITQLGILLKYKARLPPPF